MSEPRWPAEQPLADATLAIAGDRAAFHRLVRSTARLVLATILLDVRDPHLADDLTQETYLRAWRAIGGLKDPHKFNAWLIGIAKMVCIDAHRTRTRKKRDPGRSETSTGTSQAHVSDVGELPDPTPGPFEQLSQSENRERLLVALESLPQDQRQVLAMRYLSGADYNTIAASLNLTDGALRGLLHRGLAALRKRLTPSPGHPGEGGGEGSASIIERPAMGSRTLTQPSPGVPGEG